MRESDRELLKLAAKAAGVRYDINRVTPNPISGAFFGLWLLFDHEPGESTRRYWNPLTEDGDAFRLMVAIGANPAAGFVTVNLPDANDPWAVVRWMDECGTEKSKSNDPDPATAVRLSIVRAAAEIGRRMA
jgi:hypothetical protein